MAPRRSLSSTQALASYASCTGSACVSLAQNQKNYNNFVYSCCPGAGNTINSDNTCNQAVVSCLAFSVALWDQANCAGPATSTAVGVFASDAD